jgi:hypothetical protein
MPQRGLTAWALTSIRFDCVHGEISICAPDGHGKIEFVDLCAILQIG